MRRFGLTASLLTGLGVAAIIASCAENGPPEPVVGTPTAGLPTTDAPVIVTGSLSGGGWTPTVEAAASGGSVTVCHSGNGKHYTQLTLPAQGARAHLGDPSTGQGRHQYDYRVSASTPCPPPSGATGQLQICKVAGPGVTAGTSYTFTLTAANQQSRTMTVAAGAAPAGTCANVTGSYPMGTAVTVQETAQQGVTTSAIAVSPAGAQQGTSDLANRSATVIAGTGTTTLTFTNTTGAAGQTGTLTICKVAGTGVTVGTSYTFTVGAQTATVAAGAAPNGTCATTPLTVAAGNVTVTENAVSGVSVSSVSATGSGGNALVSSDLPNRSATVTVTAGQPTTVTFTNATGSGGTTGSLVICKVGGSGVAAGTPFNFTVGAQTAQVQAGAAPTGTCNTATPLTVAAGNVTVTENATTGLSVTSIAATSGGASALVSSNFANRTATVAVTAGQTTTVTFTNETTPAGQTGTLVICKVAGTGILQTDRFSFTAGNQVVQVTAGAAPNGTCADAITLPVGSTTVTELAVAGTSVQSITGTPAAPTNVNLAARSATVQITAGQETRITYTNAKP